MRRAALPQLPGNWAFAPRRWPRFPGSWASVALCGVLALAGCTASHADDGEIRVVATTEILADLVRNVGGERVRVDSLVPAGGDPHSYEPAPADAVKVTKADVTFTNHLLLEEHALIKVIDANTRPGALNVSLAESSETYGAHVIPLVEDLGLDVIWLGLAVRGDGKSRGASRASDIELRASKVEGPGALVAYLTTALGEPQIYFDSGDGLDGNDVVVLPPAAHTHLNWAFTQPGRYHLTLAAKLDGADVGQATFTFAAGVDPGGGRVLSDGHTDLAVDIDAGAIYAYSDAGTGRKQEAIPADQIVIEVPNRALQTVPSDPRFGFLGTPGTPIHQLPQAVLGKHVHGEIDPHLWQDVRNVKAYVQLIRDTLSKADPAGADGYAARARSYLSELDAMDGYVRDQIAAIPQQRRQLITTHDAFGYLAAAYDMTVAGFVVPHPAQEPSAEQVRKLSETIANLRVPAVFLEPNLHHRTGVLSQVAADHGVRVCKLYGDSFDPNATTYLAMMRHNADELRACLGEPAGGRGGGAIAGPIVIGEGHVDIGPRFVDGKWRIQLRDDTAGPPVWRDLRDVVLAANEKSLIQVPDDARFSFLGRPGDSVWLLPQVEQAGVLWPGWNTQDPQVAEAIKRDMTWRLHAVTGPGSFALFLNGPFGEPQPLFDSAKPMPQQGAIEANTHVHGNWTFTAQGTYRLDIEMSAELVSGELVSDRQTLTIQVGEVATTSMAVLVAPQSQSQSQSRLWLYALPAVVVAAALIALLWWRRRR